MLDASVARAFGMDEHDLAHILRDCDRPIATLRRAKHLDPKGFWRLDSDREPELRRTTLTQVALSQLRHVHGAGHTADDWRLPETLRLADYDLGHDDRAMHHQPVAAALGPRFYDWQLSRPAEEANRERNLHARNLLGELSHARLLRELAHPQRRNTGEPLRQVAEERTEYEVDQSDDQPDIFK